MFGLIELWEAHLRTAISTIYLSGIKLYITATSHYPLLGSHSPITIISNILHCVSIPTYAAELGVDPQADFTTWVSGATRISSFMFSFRCISDFRTIDTLAGTGNTSRQQINLYALEIKSANNQPMTEVLNHLESISGYSSEASG